MTGDSARKHVITTAKMILILLMLSLSAIFLFGKTTASVEALAVGQGSDFTEEASSEARNDDSISAGIHPVSEASSKPVDANVIVLPRETDTNEGVSVGSSKDENTAVPNVPLFTDAANESDQQDPAASSEEAAVYEQSTEVNTTLLLQSDLDMVYNREDGKVAYLTFDDGPLPSLTSAILDILKEEDVKATFFMIGSNAERYPEMVKRQYEEGHGIGNHTYSHVFKHIYSNPENYIDELIRSEQILKSILGEDKAFKLTRFPGGSFGKALAPYREAVNEAGYLYVDWNSLNGDAETSKVRPPARLVERFKETVRGQSVLVVLMHDAPNKQTTVEALPEIIQYLKTENYRFELLPGSR